MHSRSERNGKRTRLRREEREKKQDFEGRNEYLNYKKTNTKDKKKTQEEEKKPNKLSIINKT